MIIPILGIEIRKLRKPKTAWERCDTRGIKREFEEKKRAVTEILKQEVRG